MFMCGMRAVADRTHPIERGRAEDSREVAIAAAARRAFLQRQANACRQPPRPS